MTMMAVSSKSVVWRLTHPNGQTARCAIFVENSRCRLQRWLNEFVSSVEECDDHDHALRRATDIRRDFERRGFREDF